MPGKTQNKNIQRVLSALVLGPIFIIAIMFSKLLFCFLMLLITIGMLYEWCKMTKSSCSYQLLGFIIIPIPTIFLTFTAIKEVQYWLLLLYFIIIWSVDTFAMVGGKNLHGPKLAPKISPNKTWSGLIVGVLSSGVAAFLLSLFPGFNLSQSYLIPREYLIIVSIGLAFMAQMSDLFVSYFKRKFSIKDSGTIIPGHGGILDRFDSIILTAPILFVISQIL
ncbi:phosphatidate cytidylyltransferase [Candidatus Tisiphia endosymbiont of Nemotelus uliginosus]|uniref:phosphatidate cytidylyltransferase n=1 Tax=Candidatus Tisiphia endosymbiont of Nemotelus uliginosus TaxID=3077926 RepID=UPI0035C8B7D9